MGEKREIPLHLWFRDEIGRSIGKWRSKRGRCAFDAKMRGQCVGLRVRERLPSGRAGFFSHLTRLSAAPIRPHATAFALRHLRPARRAEQRAVKLHRAPARHSALTNTRAPAVAVPLRRQHHHRHRQRTAPALSTRSRRCSPRFERFPPLFILWHSFAVRSLGM